MGSPFHVETRIQGDPVAQPPFHLLQVSVEQRVLLGGHSLDARCAIDVGNRGKVAGWVDVIGGGHVRGLALLTLEVAWRLRL